MHPACGLKGKHKFVKELKFTNNSKTKNVLKMEYLVIMKTKQLNQAKLPTRSKIILINNF